MPSKFPDVTTNAHSHEEDPSRIPALVANAGHLVEGSRVDRRPCFASSPPPRRPRRVAPGPNIGVRCVALPGPSAAASLCPASANLIGRRKIAAPCGEAAPSARVTSE